MGLPQCKYVGADEMGMHGRRVSNRSAKAHLPLPLFIHSSMRTQFNLRFIFFMIEIFEGFFLL
jgi:hypothetical protein